MMKGKYTNLLFAILIGSLFFYGIPFFAYQLSSLEAKSLVVYSLLLFNPLYCIFSGYIFSKNYSVFLIPAANMLLFLPAVYIFYNDSALVYVFAYGIFTFIGSIIRYFINKKKPRNS